MRPIENLKIYVAHIIFLFDSTELDVAIVPPSLFFFFSTFI